jgi:valyl-tRNA synthetase
MSKSKGNVLDPIDLIDGIDLESLVDKRTRHLMQPQLAAKIEKATRKQFPDGITGYGTDALRYTFYSLASTGRDIKFDVGRMEGFRNFCNKIWNAARYVLMNCEDFVNDPSQPVQLSLADRWIRSRLQQTITDVTQSIEQYRFDHASQTLYDFVWNEYCDWYLELSKPVLWDEHADPALLRGTRQTLIEVLENTLRLLHPMMPFITEEIWQSVAPIAGVEGETIMLATWPDASSDAVDSDAEAEIEWLKQVIVGVRTIRAEANLPPGQSLPVLIAGCDEIDQQRIERNLVFLSRLAKIESMTALDTGEEPPPALSALAGHLELMVPMQGVVDIGAELARLDKELGKQQSEVKKLGGKLGNANFVDRAPPEVVAKEREKLASAEDAVAALQRQKQRLTELR